MMLREIIKLIPIVLLTTYPVPSMASDAAGKGHNDHNDASHSETMGAHDNVSFEVIAAQRGRLLKNTIGRGFGPQSPRDINEVAGNNLRSFSHAPSYKTMNLCDIHFHENAEHRGKNFSKFAGYGDGHGYGTGFKFSGNLTEKELMPYEHKVGVSKHGDLQPGDTIEVHYVHSSAQAKPGPTLGTCLSDAIQNPQLRVEAQVCVLVTDRNAKDFNMLARVETVNGRYQAINLPERSGTPVLYAGSTTGPSYNESGSPFQVTWSVRPKVLKLDIASVDLWLKDNVFKEDHAHGVRNLVKNLDLLSPIDQ